MNPSQIPFNVSRETNERLAHFVALFAKWAKVINLVAPSTLDEVWSRHVLDSNQLFELSPNPATWVDLGSGGGFPGIITAIRLAEIGDGWVHLVESNHKKAGFLRVALQETGGRGTVHPIRIEEAPAIVPHCDRISARALADIDTLLNYARPWLERTAHCRAFFHKGRDYKRELEQANRTWHYDLVEHQSIVETDSKILEFSNVQPL